MSNPYIEFVKKNYKKAPAKLKPTEKIKWLAQQYAKKASKDKGAGLTMSKAYLGSWIIPVSVHVCKIDRINPNIYQTQLQRYGIRDYNDSPKQMYRYDNGIHVPSKALQLPFRIILTSVDGGSETWYIENEAEFTTLCKIFVHARANPADVGVVNSVIEQHPV